MGLRKAFKKKDPTEEQLVGELQKVGISTKTQGSREQKFGAFREYAQERQSMKAQLAPASNPYANMGNAQGNPYASSKNGSSNRSSNPYAQGNGNSVNQYQRQEAGASRRPQGGQISEDGAGARASPYSTYQRNGTTPSSETNPYSRPTGSSRNYESSEGRLGTTPAGYGYTSNSNGSFGGAQRRQAAPNHDDAISLDLNALPSGTPPVRLRKPVNRNESTEGVDLNDLPEDEDLNVDVDDFLPQEQVNSEDEEVEAIKQDIRFTKQESVALTRNTLRMAQEADASATNTLGVLGSQSERLFNAEQNLLLADTQTQIAEEKVKELKKLNRSIFIPVTGNPFNKKSRLAQQEMKIKTQKEQEKYMRETNRQHMYESEQRLKSGITRNATSSDTFNKYQGDKYLLQAQRYQFEADSEDDEMEKEIAGNLDQIAGYANKLRSSARTLGTEVDAQNTRLRKIEEDADRLDINVHLNSSRLQNIR